MASQAAVGSTSISLLSAVSSPLHRESSLLELDTLTPVCLTDSVHDTALSEASLSFTNTHTRLHPVL